MPFSVTVLTVASRVSDVITGLSPSLVSTTSSIVGSKVVVSTTGVPYVQALSTVVPSKKVFLVMVSPFIFSVKKKFPKDREGMPWQGYKINPLRTGVQLLKFQWEIKQRLCRIYQPILLIQANLDETVDLRSGDIILRGVQSAVKELYWMEKSGHVVILEKQFEEVLNTTLEFIQKIIR